MGVRKGNATNESYPSKALETAGEVEHSLPAVRLTQRHKITKNIQIGTNRTPKIEANKLPQAFVDGGPHRIQACVCRTKIYGDRRVDGTYCTTMKAILLGIVLRGQPNSRM